VNPRGESGSSSDLDHGLGYGNIRAALERGCREIFFEILACQP
jgi:hypothetical protein